MTALMRGRLLAVVVLSTFCLALIAPLAGAAVPQYAKESQQAYEKQLKAGEIASATFNKRLRSLRMTLKNGEHVLYRYPKKGSKTLEEALKAKKVPVRVLKPSEAAKESTKKPGHKLRYIVGGVVVVVIVVAGLVLLFNRGRSTREE